MKKYIWLTIYFIGLVWLSYTFFYLSGNKLINIKNNSKQTILDNKKVVSENKDNIVDIIDNIEDKKKLSDEQSWNIEDKIKNIEKIQNKKLMSGDKIQKKLDDKENTDKKIIDNNQNKEDKEKNIPLENIYIGLWHWTLVRDSKYEDIYSILWLSKLPLYKIEDKDIYIKELKSIEYEDEKNNIERLIHKIWGNVIKTNLFGDKQLFVNPDIYYKKQSIILVLYDWKVYLLVLPYKKYQDYKNYLNEVLFVR